MSPFSEFEGTFSGKAPKEAASETRAAAASMMEIFVGLKDAGFTDDQATSIVAKIVVEMGRDA